MTNNAKRTTTSAGKILVLLVVALISLTFVTDWLITSSENKEFQSRYQEIEIGMQESTVVALLGAPNKRSSEFFLDQKEGFEDVYERAAQSEAIGYLIWQKKNDVVYTVGLNEEGKVAFYAASGP
jgi:hypothetical protein